tara:strand:+ start:13640 stop:14767 length:1128 start_codon:yes stop_codon:yes gene_type:complete
MSKAATLIIAASEIDANLYYATKFLAPDPFIFIEIEGTKILVMNDLEIDRARSTATVDTILSFSKYEEKANANRTTSPRMIDIVHLVLQEHNVTQIIVPGNFAFRYARDLQKLGYDVETKDDPFYEQRLLKSKEEVQSIEMAQCATEESLEIALQVIREATIRNDTIYSNGTPLTSEKIKQTIHIALLERGCVGQHTIVASGIHACDPHNEGSGPLKANTSIIIDIFPRASKTRYFADQTRTIVKGKASDKLHRLYNTVKEAQQAAIEEVCDGVNGNDIHQRICERFEAAGYTTGLRDGRMQGFFHGTGHGVGLDIHEPPRVGKTKAILRAGQVITIEPGLYYLDIGAVRIEDMVLVTNTGYQNLTKFPKFLELE